MCHFSHRLSVPTFSRLPTAEVYFGASTKDTLQADGCNIIHWQLTVRKETAHSAACPRTHSMN